MVRNCKICGKEFSPRSRQIYCSKACYRIANKKPQMEIYRWAHDNRNCTRCGAPLPPSDIGALLCDHCRRNSIIGHFVTKLADRLSERRIHLVP